MKIYIIYHEIAPTVPCADGISSAWVAKKKFPEATLKGAIYQDEKSSPRYLETGDKAYILDFSFPGEVMKNLADRGIQVRVIDHHKSAYEKLTSFQSQFYSYRFDMNYAGCDLTWKTFFPGKPLPHFLKYIAANDTRNQFYYDNWRECKIVTGAIWSLKHTFQTYDILYNLSFNEFIELCYQLGEPEFLERMETINTMLPRIYYDTFAGFDSIPHIELKTKEMKFRSDLPEVFLMNNDFPFFVVHDQKKQKHSLRSYPFGKSSVTIDGICENFGGGGHEYAAGFMKND